MKQAWLVALGLLCLAAHQDPKAPRPEDPDSPVHPRRFGQPGGIGVTRGWYVWRSWNREAQEAEVSHEGTGETYRVRVLPWLTTYRHLAYGAHPDDLLPGERVNMFFNPEGAVKRAYLVHFQDEVGQMKGHHHAWQVEGVAPGARGFSARVMNGEKPLDETVAAFELDPSCRLYRGGKKAEDPGLAAGNRLYLTWCYEGARRVVKVLADEASLGALETEGKAAVKERLAREGMGAFLEEAQAGEARLLVFSTHWAQAAALRPGQALRLRISDRAGRPAGDPVLVQIKTRKNLGAYGSGPTEILLEAPGEEKAKSLAPWTGSKVLRVFAGD